MKKILLTISLIFGITAASYAGTNIDGSVESRCTVDTDTPGTYGNPNAYTLTTLPASSGQVPIVRFDVSLANAYFAQISYPTSFSTSPSLGDSTTWTGAVAVVQTSSSDMNGYQAASTTPSTSMRQYALTIAGTTWFSASSVATYGGGQNKAFPGGSYTAIVVAQCIAQ
jgi:hypothetical protein